MAGSFPFLSHSAFLTHDLEIFIKWLQLIASSVRCKNKKKETSNINWLAIHFRVQRPKVLANQCRFFVSVVRRFITGQFPTLPFPVEYACSINSSSTWVPRSCGAIVLHKRKPIRNNWQWWIYANSGLFHSQDEFSNPKFETKTKHKESGSRNGWSNWTMWEFIVSDFEYLIFELSAGTISTKTFPCTCVPIISISSHCENLKNTRKTNLLPLI